MGKEKEAQGPSKGKELSTFSKCYLILYNGIQTAGWGYVLYQSVKYLIQNGTYKGIWAVSGQGLTIFQSLAALEVIHCMIGIVPSSALTTLLQVFSRVFQVWGILNPVPTAQNSPFIAVTLIAWGVTEVVRYSYYALHLIGAAPYFLTWCRYSFFTVLYPAGVIGEFGNVWSALDLIKKKQLYYILLPNRLNFSFNFYWFNILLVLGYLPVFPELFNHMRRQRKKILGSWQGEDTKKIK